MSTDFAGVTEGERVGDGEDDRGVGEDDRDGVEDEERGGEEVEELRLGVEAVDLDILLPYFPA